MDAGLQRGYSAFPADLTYIFAACIDRKAGCCIILMNKNAESAKCFIG